MLNQDYNNRGVTQYIAMIPIIKINFKKIHHPYSYYMLRSTYPSVHISLYIIISVVVKIWSSQDNDMCSFNQEPRYFGNISEAALLPKNTSITGAPILSVIP